MSSATTYKRKVRPLSWIMAAKFNSQCHETLEPIKRGDSILYDSKFKRAYCATSERYTAHVAEQEAQRELSQSSDERTPEQIAASDKFCEDNFGSVSNTGGGGKRDWWTQ